jgi:hypothetical protein
MTREEAAKIIEKQFDESCGDYRYQNKDKLDYEDALWLAIAALRQREEFMPPCYKPDSGDGEYSVLKQPLPPMLSKWPDVGSANTATRMRYSEIAGAILI